MAMQIDDDCPDCDGTGWNDEEGIDCGSCDGTGRLTDEPEDLSGLDEPENPERWLDPEDEETYEEES